jgi:protein-disulfide isomerase
MTYGDEPEVGRRDAAREKSKALRDAHRKRERRNRWILQGGIAGGIVVILIVIAVILFSSISPATAGPLNMQSDGITIGKAAKAVLTPAVPANGQPTATQRNKKSSVVSIRIYVDFLCPTCGQFERANRDQINSWLQDGAATLEIHPIAVLDRVSLGSSYSTRAANAAACVANYSPDNFWAFTQAMYAQQPKEQAAGFTNSQILSKAQGAGVANMSQITSCVNSQKFKSWVTDATQRAQAGPLPDSNVKAVAAPPVIIVDGLQYQAADYGSAADFQAFVVQAAGAAFSPQVSTPTPTISPTPTPTK